MNCSAHGQFSQGLNLQDLLAQNSDSLPETKPKESSPELEEPPIRVLPNVSFPYQWIAGSQQRTPSPAVHMAHPCPIQPSGLFCPTTPPSYSNLFTNPTLPILIDPTPEPISQEGPSPLKEPNFHSSFSRATNEKHQALIATYLQQNPEPPALLNNNNNTMPELKAGLPRNLSGKEEDANLWLLAMKAYFAMNPSLYEEKNKILVFLNKMDAGQGWSFTEGWLMKCVNENIKDEDWTFAKIKATFIKTFISTDHASKAWHSLAHMQMEVDPVNGDFHKFKSEFELEAAWSRVTDEHILMDMLGQAVSANLAFKMTALLEELKTHKLWLHKAGQFYDAAIWMCKLWGETNYIPASSGPKKNSQDPNAMDVNWIYLTPVQQAEHIWNNNCFICHKIGCSTKNHPRTWGQTPNCTYLPHNQQPHNILTTNTTPPIPIETPRTQPINEVASYLVFKSLVYSSFFAIFGKTGPRPDLKWKGNVQNWS